MLYREVHFKGLYVVSTTYVYNHVRRNIKCTCITYSQLFALVRPEIKLAREEVKTVFRPRIISLSIRAIHYIEFSSHCWRKVTLSLCA